MKSVFSNDDVVCMWAGRSQAHGHNAGMSLYFEGETIYSYGSHYPAARIVADGAATLVNAQRYSVTTARHVSLIRSHAPGRQILVTDPAAVTMAGHLRNHADIVESAMRAADKGTRSRTYKHLYQDDAERRVTDANAYRELFALPVPRVTLNGASIDDMKAMRASLREQLASIRADTARAIAADRERYTQPARPADRRPVY